MQRNVLWLFGLPSSGKTTLANAVQPALLPTPCVVLDGDVFRRGISRDLGFSHEDRHENLRRASEATRLLADQGVLVVCSFVTPSQQHRDEIEGTLGDQLCWLFLDCPLSCCQERDVKGLYAKALRQQIQGLTGLHAVFDAPKPGIASVQSQEQDLPTCLEIALRVFLRE